MKTQEVEEMRELFEAASLQSVDEIEARNDFLWALELEEEAIREGRIHRGFPVNPHDE
jgi:hypothetical protein